jgi:hypothetical protein
MGDDLSNERGSSGHWGTILGCAIPRVNETNAWCQSSFKMSPSLPRLKCPLFSFLSLFASFAVSLQKFLSSKL